MIDLLTINLSNYGYKISFFFAALSLIAVIGYMLWMQFFVIKNLENLRNYEFNKKFGEAYSGMRNNYTKGTLMHYQMFVVRRIIYCLIAVFLVDQ